MRPPLRRTPILCTLARGVQNNLNVTKIDGKIDDVRLYTRALTDAEIAALVPAAAVNKAPQVSAGPDQTIQDSSPATLQGSYVDDGWPATSSTAKWTVWRKISGPGDVEFENRYALATTANFTQVGMYVLELQGSDGAHLVRDTTTITVGQTPLPPR